MDRPPRRLLPPRPLIPTEPTRRCPTPMPTPTAPRTASPARPARTSSSTARTRSTGSPGGPRRWPGPKAEDKPIFLSIGYSACHWCHVMERESFENDAIAGMMNERFVNIKVDREERPDLDNLYMAAVQAMTGHGGWPMSVFLTPDLQPFYGGTYYPPTDSRGMPGFPRVLLSVERAWQERRDEITTAAADMTSQLQAAGDLPASEGDLNLTLLDDAARSLGRMFEPVHGGFGSAPKFPHPMDLRVLIRHHARTGDAHALHMVRHTLDKMARGGIYDQLGGGFARYSTDERWLAPHFEKMLYDNALLTTVYLEAYQLTRDEEYAADRPRDDRLHPGPDDRAPKGPSTPPRTPTPKGSRGSSTSGTLAEIREVLGPDRAATFAAVYDVAEGGNWEHQTILNLPEPIAAVATPRPRRGELAGRTGRGPGQALRRPRAAHPPRQGHQGPDLVERPDARRPGRSVDRPRRAPLRRGGRPGGRLPPPDHADGRRPPAPDLQGRPGQAQRLPRRLRQPDRRPDPPVRGDRRRPAGSRRPWS